MKCVTVEREKDAAGGYKTRVRGSDAVLCKDIFFLPAAYKLCLERKGSVDERLGPEQVFK